MTKYTITDYETESGEPHILNLPPLNLSGAKMICYIINVILSDMEGESHFIVEPLNHYA